MSRLALIFGFCLAMIGAQLASAQGLSGLARFEPEGSGFVQRGKSLSLTLNLSQPVPYRAYTLTEPARLVVDFREVDWGGADPADLSEPKGVIEAKMGSFRPGWSRLVVSLADTYALRHVEMKRDAVTGQARLKAALHLTDAENFAALSGPPQSDAWPEQALPPKLPDAKEQGRIRIVLDPGHGGIDPGAQRDAYSEKDLMLTFARELAEQLRRNENIDVILTRNDDSFVSLERRVAIAHWAGADLFISLHADALSEGHAHGATVHTLSEEASDTATALLAERHDRADMLSGTDLSGQDDSVADVLLDFARRETHPRSEQLADALIEGLKAKGAPLNRRPHRAAAFSVLKAADIPSVLLEIGFLSSKRDFANIVDPAWRARMAEGLAEGVASWLITDAAMRKVLRQ